MILHCCMSLLYNLSVYDVALLHISDHTPALACAPNDRVADCLTIILTHMIPQTPNNSLQRAFKFENTPSGLRKN